MTATAAFEAARFAYEVPDLWDKPPSVRLHAAIEAYLAALPGEAKPVAWEGVADGIRYGLTANPKIAQLWRETGRVVTPLYPAPPSERKVIEALKGLLVYTFEDDPGTLILSYDGTALARIDLDTEPGSALLKLEQELAALRASGGTP